MAANTRTPAMKTENTQHLLRILALILRVALAAVFLLAGFSKAGDPAEFARAIDLYRAVPHTLAIITALFLPWLEITCAIAIFFRQLRAGATALLLACSAVFVVMLLSALVRGLDISCGCFGNAGSATGGAALLLSLARALVLVAASALLLAREIKTRRAKTTPM